MYYRFVNNPLSKSVGDCAVRAISKALDLSWEDAYWELCSQGFRIADMPSSNATIGALLRKEGYRQYMIPNNCPNCVSVYEFGKEHPHGTYVLMLPNHVVCMVDGAVWDSWDSTNETVLYYFTKENE